MNFFERYVNSKFYQYTDFFFKMILLNLYMIITVVMGLVVFGLPLSIAAGILSLRIILKKTSSSVLETYMSVLKSIFKQSLLPILIFEVIVGVLLFNTVYFYYGLEPFDWFNFISFMMMASLLLVSTVAFIHGIVVCNIYDLKIRALIKHSYLLTVGFMFRTLIMVILGFVFIYTLILVPLLGLLFGLSGFSLLSLLVLIDGYKKIESLENELNIKVEKIDM